jgi:hypothetical protein
MPTKTKPKSSKKNRQRKIQVGDRIALLHWPKGDCAVVVEDRGYLGVNGRRILRIRQRYDEWNEVEYEIPEEEAVLLTKSTPRKRSLASTSTMSHSDPAPRSQS